MYIYVYIYIYIYTYAAGQTPVEPARPAGKPCYTTEYPEAARFCGVARCLSIYMRLSLRLWTPPLFLSLPPLSLSLSIPLLSLSFSPSLSLSLPLHASTPLPLSTLPLSTFLSTSHLPSTPRSGQHLASHSSVNVDAKSKV